MRCISLAALFVTNRGIPARAREGGKERRRLSWNETFTRLYKSSWNPRDVGQTWIWQRWWIRLLSPIKSDAMTPALISLISFQPRPVSAGLSLTFSSLFLALYPTSPLPSRKPQASEKIDRAYPRRPGYPGKMRTRVIALWSRKKPRRWSSECAARKHPSADLLRRGGYRFDAGLVCGRWWPPLYVTATSLSTRPGINRSP